MSVVGNNVHAIAELTGPCCCKAFVRAALTEAVVSAQKYFNVSLVASDQIVCTYSARHPHECRGEKCPYYKQTDKATEILGFLKEDVKQVEPELSKVEQLQKRAMELGAQGSKLIQTSSIVVAEWVLWKCKYGCPFYNKDSLHPPLAPSPEETKRMLKEYDKALLLTGPDGPKLSQHAIALEHEAYAMGYYKSFALLALPFGTGPT